MLDPYWQYQVPLWVVIFLFLALLLVPMEAGYRLGKRHRALHPDSEGVARPDLTLTAMLALLGLMLAFTYSFSLSRADLRKVAIIREVNAIRTAFLRADLLAEPGRTEVRQVLFDYAKSRYIEPGSIRTSAELQKVIDRSVEIQSKIWPAVKSALQQNGDMRGLLVPAVNDVLDAHTSRMAVIYDRLPSPLLALLLTIAALSLSSAAYNSALSDRFMRWRMTAFALVLSSLMYIILDYDMMMRGLIQVDHQSLVLLIRDMSAALQG